MTNRYKHYLFEIKKHMTRLQELESGERGPKYRRLRKIHQDAIIGYTKRIKRIGRVEPIIKITGTSFQKVGTISIQKPVEIYFSACIPEEVNMILEHDYKGVHIEVLEVIIPGETKILNDEQ